MPGGPAVTILDGGMGRQLSRMGAPLRLPEWSGLALIEAPQFVSEAHDAFIASGARVLVAGSLPPVFQSYRPELFDADRAPAIIGVLVSGLAPHIALWLIETQNSTVETGAAIAAAARSGAARIGVYANAFSSEPAADEPYAGISELLDDLGRERYVEWAAQWVRSGATILGGCCGIGPEHIAALRAHFR